MGDCQMAMLTFPALSAIARSLVYPPTLRLQVHFIFERNAALVEGFAFTSDVAERCITPPDDRYLVK